MTNKPYAFIDAPPPDSRTRKGLYVEMLEDFMATGKRSVIVKMQDKPAISAYNGLKTALRNNKEQFASVRVVLRDPEVYIVRD